MGAPSNEPTAAQGESLDEALQIVRREAADMKRHFEISGNADSGNDEENVDKALEHAGFMLDRLRTSSLNPSQYNELFMSVTNELRHLGMYLNDLIASQDALEYGSQLYEKVQYNANIIPRLYLMITVGASMLKFRPELTRAVLDDLVEMSRGVQHPLRGIFLRNYLLQSTKQILPDLVIVVDEAESSQKTAQKVEETVEHGTVDDSIEMLLKNFTEMNKLWVRIQYQGSTRQASQRRLERQEVRNLVGTNLHRLSQLEGLTKAKYTDHVLPELLQQIVNCRDSLAQSYLMESIIQVFPDEYHLDTMKPFLAATAALHTSVNAKSIVIALVDRLSNYVLNEQAANGQQLKLEGKDGDLFTVFTEQLAHIIDGRESLELEDVLSMEASLAHLALTNYPEHIEYIDKILETTGDIIGQHLAKKNQKTLPASVPAAREVINLIKLPITQYASAGKVMKVLSLKSLKSAFSVLAAPTKKIIAAYFVSKMIENAAQVDEANLDAFLDMIRSLYSVSIEADSPDDEDLDLAARCVDLVNKTEPKAHFAMLCRVRREFGTTGIEQKAKLLPSIFSQFCDIGVTMNKSHEGDKLCEEAFQAAHETVRSLANDDLAMIPIRLYLEGASSLQHCAYEGAVDLCYEFFTQAFVLYEEEISDSREQVWALQLLSGTLLSIKCFKEDEHGSLRSQLTLASSRLLRKADQTRAILACCIVFWSSHVKQEDSGECVQMRDAKKVADLLKKAIKTTEKCLESELKVQLFVEILEKIYNLKNYGYDASTLEPLQVQIMQKIDDENLSSESIETHLNKIRALLSGEKEKNADEEQDEEVEEEKVNIVNQEPEHQSATETIVTNDDDNAEKQDQDLVANEQPPIEKEEEIVSINNDGENSSTN